MGIKIILSSHYQYELLIIQILNVYFLCLIFWEGFENGEDHQ